VHLPSVRRILRPRELQGRRNVGLGEETGVAVMSADIDPTSVIALLFYAVFMVLCIYLGHRIKPKDKK